MTEAVRSHRAALAGSHAGPFLQSHGCFFQQEAGASVRLSSHGRRIRTGGRSSAVFATEHSRAAVCHCRFSTHCSRHVQFALDTTCCGLIQRNHLSMLMHPSPHSVLSRKQISNAMSKAHRMAHCPTGRATRAAQRPPLQGVRKFTCRASSSIMCFAFGTVIRGDQLQPSLPSRLAVLVLSIPQVSSNQRMNRWASCTFEFALSSSACSGQSGSGDKMPRRGCLDPSEKDSCEAFSLIKLQSGVLIFFTFNGMRSIIGAGLCPGEAFVLK